MADYFSLKKIKNKKKLTINFMKTISNRANTAQQQPKRIFRLYNQQPSPAMCNIEQRKK
jgi:hypothetical protein